MKVMFVESTVADAARAVKAVAEMFGCSIDVAWKNYTHDFIKDSFTLQQIKEELQKNIF